uniref:PI31 proteasome regulator N-terminal domain-containing protein n=1 Tax=Kalanchoe fedtschenkoi TaxID=63787 RepID=A0A7N0RHD1_KALFE
MALENGAMAVIRASRPSFRNTHDKIAFAVHASFVASGYLLTAVGESAVDDSALSSSSTEEVSLDGWNSMDDQYAFVYHNPEDGKKVVVKCISINDKLLMDAFRAGQSEPLHVEFNVEEYVEQEKETYNNYKDHYKNFSGLVKRLETELFSKLESKQAAASSDKSSSSKSNELETNPHGTQPLRVDPDRDDVPYSGSGFVYPSIPVNPGGYSDLIPGPPAGVFPNRRGLDADGSNLVGPNDPRWFGGPGFRGGLQPDIPPGARYDPIGPPDVPGFEPNRFMRQPRRPGTGRGHPDLEHFPGGSDFI